VTMQRTIAARDRRAYSQTLRINCAQIARSIRRRRVAITRMG
jgi:hypothetical protein